MRVGQFATADVHVLLDPAPAELSTMLAAAAADVRAAHGEVLFVFYYSGHSDGQSLYPHGEAVPVGALRDDIEHIGARIRVGILDTCRGGSWTQAKGLTVGPPLDAADLFNVSTEGTALVSSSSGFESAHEADAVSGSFFTHHFAAGLLGAADRTGDGNITLEEAYDYAKERTVRDSARLAAVPQHPSFDLQLRGRQDIVLTMVSTSPSALEVLPTPTPLEIIHLPSGVTIAEVPPGSLPVRIAVPPARYLVRSVVEGRVMSHEFEIHPGETVSIAGGQLEATGDPRLARKGDEPAPREAPVADATTPPKHWGIWQLFLGESSVTLPGATITTSSGSAQVQGLSERRFAAAYTFNFGITDRLSWSAPGSFSYRFGQAEAFEVIASAGLGFNGIDNVVGIYFTPNAGLEARIWTAQNQSLTLGAWASFSTALRTATRASDLPNGLGKLLATGGAIGYNVTIGNVVSLHLAAGATTYEAVAPKTYFTPGPFVFVGSESLAYQYRPLVQVHVSRRFSFDAVAAWGYNLSTGAFSDEYLGGFTYAY